ncbi:PREDICTED: methyltransferase-like protein 13 isoform X4 [Camelina sativa]|uniref:Methyltransferase-like protein 13 isoform X4 n=2 Tax=Camelina sativa TaxID=90675 RepID=A0ABM0Z447_CAMSA|nr:PREDICTED: methyltransferase-like protein 13 isoform X4 [Camelina sativa]
MGTKKGSKAASSDDFLQTLEDFTSKENWDKFFTLRGNDDSFEWYAEWPQLRDSLLPLLQDSSSSSSGSLQILVPGCGNSRLSEHLYDAGFRDITNVDFSKVVISDMLRRNIRTRPELRWRVMDITKMQLADESFDTVLDKGALDALMEPEVGTKLGSQYLSEAKRVLKPGGKFICLTLAESHVLALLFSKLRFGWKMTVHSISQKRSNLKTFMVVAEKENSVLLHDITSSFDLLSIGRNDNQGSGMREALENENQIRRDCNNGSDLLYSHEDLKLGIKGNLAEFTGGRRIKFTLGGQGSNFSYRAVLLDAQKQTEPFVYHCGVFLVPKTRAHEWLFCSEEGQWQVVESSQAARLIMVFLDSSHSGATMEDVQTDLSPMVTQLAPRKDDEEARIPYMMASDGIKKCDTVHEVTSSLTGKVVVEDVVYESTPSNPEGVSPSSDLAFRRLVFKRTEGLIQSEALLVEDGEILEQPQNEKTKTVSQSKRKGNKKRNQESSGPLMKVSHDYLASSYHTGIISGFTLVSSYLKNAESCGKMVKTVIIGLGAGLLPMFLHGCLPFSDIEAVELDPVMLSVGNDYFGFTQTDRLKVHISDGIKFIRDITNSKTPSEETANAVPKPQTTSSNGESATYNVKGGTCPDILIIDVDSADSSGGLTCPASEFIEETFLLSVKRALPQHGLFVVNLVSRSQSVKDMVVSRMKKVFDHLFGLQLEEEDDVNVVLFGLCSETVISESDIPESAVILEGLLKCQRLETKQSIIDATKKLKCWK